MKLHYEQIHLHIVDLEPWVNEEYHGLDIHWASDIGFGQYRIYRPVNSSQWYADSEYMDCSGQKEFLKMLLGLLPNMIEVNN